MATVLVSNITSVEGDIPKGPVRLVISTRTSPPAIPTKIEDVIGTVSSDAPTFMKLLTGWRDLGRTTTDGVTITASFDLTDGIETDQDDEPIGGGEPTGLERTVSAGILELNETNRRDLLGMTTSTAVAAGGSGATANVAQKRQSIGGLDERIEQQLVILQMHPTTKKLKMWAFEKAILSEIGDVQLNKEGNATDASWVLRKNLTTNIYGKYFESDAAIPGA